MKKLNSTDVERYVNSPTHCPYCKADDIEAGNHEAEEEIVTCLVTCLKCGRQWTDVFKVIGIREG